MEELMNGAKIEYEFLDKKLSLNTNKVKTYKKDNVKIKENLYIPRILPRLYEINSINLLLLNVRSVKSELRTTVTFKYAISCNYKNEYLINQNYVKTFCRNVDFSNNIDLKNIKLKIVDYHIVTERVVNIYLKITS